jgi:hypothetical protein
MAMRQALASAGNDPEHDTHEEGLLTPMQV